jgi:ATP-dependent DNA helicase RecG
MPQSALASALQLTVKGIEKQLKILREQGIIRRVGSARGGHWEVLSK